MSSCKGQITIVTSLCKGQITSVTSSCKGQITIVTSSCKVVFPNLFIAADSTTFENVVTDGPRLTIFLNFTGVIVYFVNCLNKTLLILIHCVFYLFLLIYGLTSSAHVTKI